MSCLTKCLSIRSKAHFRYVFQIARRIKQPYYGLYIAEKYLEQPAYAVVASRKVGNAVIRNRCRRRIKEFFRVNQKQLLNHYDIVLIVYRSMAKKTSFEIHRSLKETMILQGIWNE